MASTPLSSATTYLPQTQILSFYDARQWGDLTLDNNTRESSTNVLTDLYIAQWLLSASGQVEAACLVGGKYTPTDLNSLTGASQAFLWKLVADLAFYFGTQRRKPSAPTTEAYVAAMENLERLRLGERIFGLQEQANAGLPNTTTRTAAALQASGLASQQAAGYFGTRGSTLVANGSFPNSGCGGC